MARFIIVPVDDIDQQGLAALVAVNPDWIAVAKPLGARLTVLTMALGGYADSGEETPYSDIYVAMPFEEFCKLLKPASALGLLGSIAPEEA